MLSLTSASASKLPSAAPPASTFFAHQRDATSLQDLDIVRKIVEREGCLEAMTQLLTTHARASHKDKGSMAASATLAAAPMVVNSLLDQLRSVGVQIVESIVKWKRLQPASGSPHEPVFQWRGLNYLVKMLSDLDFLALHGATVAQLQAFQGLRLQRNPFVSPLHLDHAALLEPTADMACRLSLFVGNVDMRRVWSACQTLLQEEQTLQANDVQQSNGDADDGIATPVANTTTTRLHWSHRPMKLTISASSPTLRSLGSIGTGDPAAAMSSTAQETMAFDVELAKELVFQHEHELGAMKEELAVLQRKLQKNLTMAPDRRRQLQMRIATLNNEVKQRSGDLFHRRNELQRKEAVLRMDKRRRGKANEFTRLLQQQQQQQLRQPASPRDGDDTNDPQESAPERELHAMSQPQGHFTATETFRAALQADELRRQDLIEKLATHSKVRASLSVTKRKLLSLSPSPSTCSSPQHLRFAQVRPGSSGRGGDTSGSISISKASPSSASLETMTCSQVETFVSGLGLGEDAARYGSLLKAQGIDGKLLVQAQDSDLEELGIPIRLHRLKILDATRQSTTH